MVCGVVVNMAIVVGEREGAQRIYSMFLPLCVCVCVSVCLWERVLLCYSNTIVCSIVSLFSLTCSHIIAHSLVVTYSREQATYWEVFQGNV